MKPFKRLLEFLFGRSPDVFDKEGEIDLRLPDQVWTNWARRYWQNEFNWRRHQGVVWSPGHENPDEGGLPAQVTPLPEPSRTEESAKSA